MITISRQDLMRVCERCRGFGPLPYGSKFRHENRKAIKAKVEKHRSEKLSLTRGLLAKHYRESRSESMEKMK